MEQEEEHKSHKSKLEHKPKESCIREIDTDKEAAEWVQDRELVEVEVQAKEEV